MNETSLLVSLPLIAAIFAAIAPRVAATTGVIATLGNAILVGLLAHRVGTTGATSEALGGWTAPLGIGFTADGLAALMLVMTALVGLGVSVQVAGVPPGGPRGAHQRTAFWPLWLVTLGAMNALFLSADLFNLYVTFEILGLAAVGLTALSGTRTALRAAFDYLSAGLAGSLLLLLGVALAYAAAGRVDLDVVPTLAASSEGRIALGLIFAGLAVKAALFPLHFWMPAAHASAAPAASALLSALVVKAALYVVLRLSIEGGAAAELLRAALAVAGAGAMLWGGWHALRADRLKLLVAHSTVAQVGLIALAVGLSGSAADSTLWQASALLMLSHALAKAAMFLAVGRIAEELGHDRISGLNREELRPGAAEFAFAIAAISLIGLPPTAGFVGKWMLLDGLIDRGAWPWVALVLFGTVLSAAYLVRVVSRCLRGGPHVAPGARRAAWRSGDVAALGLATAALALGLASALPFTLLDATLT
jgi:formate hydrogenlyase subunit 3/multisubunit Na+/H+ antiporter MnhD subunit